MKALTPSRTLLVLLLGLMAPYFWVESLLLWSLHVYTPLLKWLSAAFGTTGAWIPTVSGFFHSILVATVLAAALRFIVQREWLVASAAFCLAFLAAFYVPDFFESDVSLNDQFVLFASSLISVLVLLLCVVAFLALLSRFPRPHGV
jgi:hypothetical protein